jgi:hypothetical protein
MALVPRQDHDPRVHTAALGLSVLVPLAAYLATVSGSGYWLDAGELTAAAVDLDIAHPPGQPLATLLGHAATLIPLGSLALRVAFAQAVCAALASGFTYSAIATTIRALGVQHDRVVVPMALGASWLAAGSYGWWLQAVRPEVYALQALLVAIAVERIVTLEAAWPTRDLRPLPAAALALGLSLANHHFMGFLCFPAIAPTLARVVRARGTRPLAISLAMIAVGLSTYLYLPLRAASEPAMNLGHPTSLSRIYWVVSAQAFQGTHDLPTEPLGDRMLDVVVSLVDSLHALPIFFALGGAYVLLRAPGAARIGYVWLALVLFSFVGRGWLGFVRGNPDALGYLMPAMAGVAALSVSLVAAIVSTLGTRDDRAPRAPSVGLGAVALAVALLGAVQIVSTRARADLGRFHATDDVDEQRVRTLPSRAVVLLYSPQTLFRFYELAATERIRPDVTVIPMPLLAYPGMIDAIVRRSPDVAGVLRSELLDGEPAASELQSLASRRPVLVELDVRVPIALHETLLPDRMLYAVEPAGTTDADIRAACERRTMVLDTLRTAMGQSEDRETRAQMLWLHYNDALYAASVGELDAARLSVQRGLALSPSARELRMLSDALADPRRRGPIDVRPFTVGADSLAP